MIGPTIYEVLRDKLGREPTHAELCADVRRILDEAWEERVTKAKPKANPKAKKGKSR